MTPHDHNRTLGIIYGVIGALGLVGLIVVAVLEVRRRPHDAAERLQWLLYLLPLPLLHLLAARGVLTLRRWGRVLALLFAILYVWLFPLGTLLAVYAWWVLYGETGRQLYGRAKPHNLNEG